jgi:hypothetical protein
MDILVNFVKICTKRSRLCRATIPIIALALLPRQNHRRRHQGLGSTLHQIVKTTAAWTGDRESGLAR